VYYGHWARLVILSLSQEQLAVASSMALAQVIAKAFGVDYLVAGSVEMPCHDLETACWVAELVEISYRDWQAVEAAGDIERAWA
jgi:hypothetical protein